MKQYLKQHKNTIFVITIFSIFAIFLLVQHQFLYLHHDDYGYASLSYAYNVKDAQGTNYTFSQILEFLKGHYEVWGGRILFFFVEIVLLRYTGLTGFRIVQALAVFGIFFMIYKILSKVLKDKVENWKLALVVTALYGVTEILTFRTGFFWITASVLYVIPIFFLLLFAYIYSFKTKQESKSTEIIYNIILGISIFLATCSQEQVGVASFMYIIIWTIYHIIKDKKLNKLDIILAIIGTIGFAILMLAPGNAIRKQHPTSIEFYQTPIVQRTLTGIKETIAGNFGANNKIFGIFFFSTVLLATIKGIQKKLGYKYVNYISLLSTTGIFLMMFIKSEGYFSYVYSLNNGMKYTILITGITLLQLALMAYNITIYLWHEKSEQILFLFYIAIISQGVMIVAPYFALRSSIIFEILYYIIGIKILGDIYSETENKEIVTYVLIPFLMICMLNMIYITKGYYNNNQVNKENHEKLLAVEKQIEQGENVTEVTLKKLPDLLYSGDQPYVEGAEYILYYMKEYYKLPDDFVIQYVD